MEEMGAEPLYLTNIIEAISRLIIVVNNKVIFSLDFNITIKFKIARATTPHSKKLSVISSTLNPFYNQINFTITAHQISAPYNDYVKIFIIPTASIMGFQAGNLDFSATSNCVGCHIKGCVWETYNIVRLRYCGRVYSIAIGNPVQKIGLPYNNYLYPN